MPLDTPRFVGLWWDGLNHCEVENTYQYFREKYPTLDSKCQSQKLNQEMLHRGRFFIWGCAFWYFSLFRTSCFPFLLLSSTSLKSTMDSTIPFRLKDYPVVIGIDFGKTWQQDKRFRLGVLTSKPSSSCYRYHLFGGCLRYNNIWKRSVWYQYMVSDRKN